MDQGNLGFLGEITRPDRVVMGYASTERRDADKEIITRPAITNALKFYSYYRTLCEMHDRNYRNPIGKVFYLRVLPKGLFIGAEVYSKSAWKKIKSGLYNGFSIGGYVEGRSPHDEYILTEIELTEISLAHSPANQDCFFIKPETEKKIVAALTDLNQRAYLHKNLVPAPQHSPSNCELTSLEIIENLAQENEILMRSLQQLLLTKRPFWQKLFKK